jgi:hypothetical protein
MTTSNYTTCHNLRTSKMNNRNGWWRSIFQLEINFVQIVLCCQVALEEIC